MHGAYADHPKAQDAQDAASEGSRKGTQAPRGALQEARPAPPAAARAKTAEAVFASKEAERRRSRTDPAVGCTT